MKLSVLDRVLLMPLLVDLTKKGTYVDLKMANGLVDKIGFGADEHEKLEFKQTDTLLEWNQEVGKEPLDVDLNDAETAMIAKKLKELGETEQFTSQHVPVYEMFVKDEGETKED